MLYGDNKIREMARRPDSGRADYDVVCLLKRQHRRRCKQAVKRAILTGEDDFDYQPPRRPWDFRAFVVYKRPHKWATAVTSHLEGQGAKEAYFRSKMRKYHHYRFYNFYEPVFVGMCFTISENEYERWMEDRVRCFQDIMSKPDGHRLIHHMFDAVLQGTQDVKPYLWRLHRFKSRQVDELYDAWVESGKNIQELKRRFW